MKIFRKSTQFANLFLRFNSNFISNFPPVILEGLLHTLLCQTISYVCLYILWWFPVEGASKNYEKHYLGFAKINSITKLLFWLWAHAKAINVATRDGTLERPGTIIDSCCLAQESIWQTRRNMYSICICGASHTRYTHHVISSLFSSTKKHDAKVKTQIFHLLFQRPSTQGDGVYKL